MNLNKLISTPEELEPETLIRLFPLLGTLERQQLFVMRILRGTRAAYEDMNVFENAVAVLNGINPNVDAIEGSKPEYIWRALDLIFKLHPNLELSWEVEQYIKYINNDNGIYFYHPKLQLDNPDYKAIKDKALNGPFPLKENYLEIQAGHYLKIKLYTNQNRG